jgi:Protein of unknown function (DUF1553)/Protein of unknown function (DUF1549)/Planctomycete cytochrome C
MVIFNLNFNLFYIMLRKALLGVSILLFFGLIFQISSCNVFKAKVDYSADVKPIINKHCISCHGGVKKQSGFSLLFKEEAFAKAKSGKYAIIPGDADGSELIRRITNSDPEERMPHHKNPLSKGEIEVFRKWIDQGAEWEVHWAYKSIEKPQIPNVTDKWVRNDIDKYIFENVKKQGMDVSPEADPATLARRVSLDLVGFPLNNAQKNAYIKTPSDKTYTAYVESLLASPHYGEKWTSLWLDLARYADTKGYERDGNREIWKYRDWLIDAFNEDKPYDVFLKEQLAGDLLPNPTESMYVATAFNRNSMTNDEGGTDNEEFRSAAAVDRVNTTWETLMSTTFACVQCHSHPYDPFTHEDYYKFMSFFNNSRDEDTYDDYPLYRHYKSEDKQKLDKVENWFKSQVSETEQKRIGLFLKTLQPSYNSLTMDKFENAELSDTKWLAMRQPSVARLKNVNLDDKNLLLLKIIHFVPNNTVSLHLDSPTGTVIGSFHNSAFSPGKTWELKEVPLSKVSGTHDIYFTFNNKTLKDPKLNGILFDWLYFTKDLPGANKPGYKEIKSKYWELVNAKPETTTPIFLENQKDFLRKNQIYERGSFLSRTKEVVPGLPAIFNAKGNFNNRLDLANWMTSRENPLVSRTMVNRLWEQLFGVGIVETLEDLGSQGASPINQKLLDDLSLKYMTDFKWSTKRLLKELVTSATYRQSSVASPEALSKDKFNAFLARGPRIRLSAEQIRDQALAISEQMNSKMYGPPVMPYQPQGIWASPYNGDKWIRSKGDEQYRRSVYTFWKRTGAYPSMTTFDGTGREVCVSRRIRTNTPLQAFVTLNDSVYVDLSKKLAQKVFSLGKNNPEMAIKLAYSKATGRGITPAKMKILFTLFENSKLKYSKEPTLIEKISFGKNIDLAALTVVCNAILNLDEVITKS